MKCKKYFNLFSMEEHQKVETTERQFDKMDFANDLYLRFCDRTCLDVVEEFNKLTERGSVEDYQEKFEDLRSFMLQYNLHLNEEYFVSSFVSGLTKKPKLDLR